MTDAPAPVYFCSFCGKSQHDVAKLVAGPAVFICDECIALCDDIAGPTGDVSRALLKAAIHGCRLLAELRWHDRLNETGRAVWWKLESALEQYMLTKAGPAPIITPAFGAESDGAQT